MAVLARADEADRRHFRFVAAVEDEPAPAATGIEVLPPNQTASARKFACNRGGLHLLADEPSGKDGGRNAGRQLAGPAVRHRRCSQREVLRVGKAVLALEQL